MSMSKNDEKAIEKAATDADARTQARVIESLVLRGDLSGLAPQDRARYYVQTCESLGLNPSSQPFAFLRLNGKEVLYATRGATDQLAAIHRINREIIDGPKIVDIAGTKVAYCVARASMTNGRSETATATLPVVDPANLYMKLETKAKRRATLSILGLGLLDEMELETIPAKAQEPGGGVDFSTLNAEPAPAVVTRADLAALDASAQAVRAAEVRALAPPPAEPAEPADLVADIEVQVCRCDTPAQLADLWIAARADVARLPKAAQTRAWKLVGQRAEVIGSSAGAVRAEVTRRDVPPRDDGPGGAPKPAANDAAPDAQGSAAGTAPAQGALAMVPPWCCDEASARAHIAGYQHTLAVERSARRYRQGLPVYARELLALRYQRLSWDPRDGEITIESARELVARWIAQGPIERVRPAARAR